MLIIAPELRRVLRYRTHASNSLRAKSSGATPGGATFSTRVRPLSSASRPSDAAAPLICFDASTINILRNILNYRFIVARAFILWQMDVKIDLDRWQLETC